MFDSHCHLDDSAFEKDVEAVIERARAAGVEGMLTIDPPLAFLDRFPFLLASAGVHPHEAGSATHETIPELRRRCKHPRIVAVGEIGLDFHYDFAPREIQRQVFIEQLELASELDLPVIIHTRGAWAETFDILEQHWRGPGIMHCFSGGPAEAERSAAMGFYLAFGGVITFPKADPVRAAAAAVPLDRLLLETDAPYLAPAPHRGKRNEPALLRYTAERLAAVRGLSPAELTAATSTNFRRLFSLD